MGMGANNSVGPVQRGSGSKQRGGRETSHTTAAMGPGSLKDTPMEEGESDQKTLQKLFILGFFSFLIIFG